MGLEQTSSLPDVLNIEYNVIFIWPQRFVGIFMVRMST